MKKYALDVLEGSSDIFCWFECYGPMVTDSPDPIQAAPGETLTDFIGDYYFNDNLGTSKIGYTFYNQDDATDSVMVIVYYKVMPTPISTIAIDPIDTCFQFQQNPDTVNYGRITQAILVDVNEVEITWELYSPLSTYQLTRTYNYVDTGAVLVRLTLNCSSSKGEVILGDVIMSEYVDTSSININEADIFSYKCNVFPNPAEGNINFDYQLENNLQHSLIIYNTLGSRMKKIELNKFANNLNLNISDWKSGMYFYSIFKQDESKFNGRFIVK